MTSGGLDSLFFKLIKKNNPKQLQQFSSEIKSVFGDRFYLEIQRHNDFEEKAIQHNLLELHHHL